MSVTTFNLTPEQAKKIIRINHTNSRGERSLHIIIPERICFGTGHRPEGDWFLHAFDLDRQAMRLFALRDIDRWVFGPAAAEPAVAPAMIDPIPATVDT